SVTWIASTVHQVSVATAIAFAKLAPEPAIGYFGKQGVIDHIIDVLGPVVGSLDGGLNNLNIVVNNIFEETGNPVYLRFGAAGNITEGGAIVGSDHGKQVGEFRNL